MHAAARSILVALALTFALPAGAAAEDPCRDEGGQLISETVQQWVRGTGHPAGNTATVGVGDVPHLSDEAPERSVTAGAGGGYLTTVTSGFLGQWSQSDTLTMTGASPGCLDTLAFTLYALPSSAIATGDHMLCLRIEASGTEILRTGYRAVETTANAGGSATYELRFATTRLIERTAAVGLDPAAPHDLRVQVSPCLVVDTPTVYVYDAVEVPANVKLNADDLEGFTIVD